MAIPLRSYLLPVLCALVVAACGVERKIEAEKPGSGVNVSLPQVAAGAGQVGDLDDDGVNKPVHPPEMEEATLVAEALVVENQALREHVEEQVALVASLERQLAEALVQLDGVRMATPVVVAAASGGVPGETVVMVDDLSRVRVLDVNRDQHVAVVSGGQRVGMKVGMRFYVLREEKMIARLRLIDVREQVAGGLIERVEKNVFPEEGDRLVLSSKQDG